MGSSPTRPTARAVPPACCLRLQADEDPEQYPTAAMGAMHFAMVGDELAAGAAERLGLSG